MCEGEYLDNGMYAITSVLISVGAGCENMMSRSAGRNAENTTVQCCLRSRDTNRRYGYVPCCSESKAKPDNSETMRSGLSCIIVLSLVCLAPLCHLGTRWSKWMQSEAFPSSLHASHAKTTDRIENICCTTCVSV